MAKPNELKLVYVLKIGYNSLGEGLYEFIFAKNLDALLDQDIIEDLMWDQSPASSKDNALPPTNELVDAVYSLKTLDFDLWCLHEANDRPYMDGVYTIHCLAYEQEKEEDYEYEDYETMFDEKEESPLLVFHFGMTLEQVEDLLYGRDIVLHNGSFVSSEHIAED